MARSSRLECGGGDDSESDNAKGDDEPQAQPSFQPLQRDHRDLDLIGGKQGLVVTPALPLLPVALPRCDTERQRLGWWGWAASGTEICAGPGVGRPGRGWQMALCRLNKMKAIGKRAYRACVSLTNHQTDKSDKGTVDRVTATAFPT